MLCSQLLGAKIRYYDGSVELTAELIEDRSDEIEIFQIARYISSKGRPRRRESPDMPGTELAARQSLTCM